MEPLAKLTDAETNQMVVDTIQKHFDIYPDLMDLIHEHYFDLWTILTADVPRMASQITTLTAERDAAIAEKEKVERAQKMQDDLLRLMWEPNTTGGQDEIK